MLEYRGRGTIEREIAGCMCSDVGEGKIGGSGKAGDRVGDKHRRSRDG